MDTVLGLSKPFEAHVPHITKLVDILEERSKRAECPYYTELDRIYLDIHEMEKKFFQ